MLYQAEQKTSDVWTACHHTLNNSIYSSTVNSELTVLGKAHNENGNNYLSIQKRNDWVTYLDEQAQLTKTKYSQQENSKVKAFVETDLQNS